MILAAPLVIPFAEAVGISIATLGMAKAADMVNDYIQENPEQSIKILSTIVPGVGIGEIFMKKGKDEEVEEEVEVEDVDARDLTRAEKAKMMKELAKSGGGNMREKMKKGYEEIIQPGESDRELDDAEDRYDGGLEEVSKPKFDYKKFFKKRYADGGAIGIEVLFEEKKPRQGLFMGGPALEGPALGIYNSMKAYQSFTDQEIANAIKEAGYELPTADSGTTPDSSTPSVSANLGITDPQPYSAVDQREYNMDARNFGPGKKMEINPAALGMSFYDAEPKKSPEGFIGKTIDAFTSVPGKQLSQFRTPTGISPRGPAELGFMTKDIEGLPGLNRDMIRSQYDNYSQFFGRPSNFASARVPGKAGQLLNMVPYVGTAKRGLEAIFGPAGDKSLQSKYTVDGAGFGNTGARDEFGLATFDRKDGFLGLTGDTTRDYTNRMEDKIGDLTSFFERTFKERGLGDFDIDDLDIDKMKTINSFYAKQLPAYLQRVAVEKLNRQQKDSIDRKRQQDLEIAAKKRRDAAATIAAAEKAARERELARRQTIVDAQKATTGFTTSGGAGNYRSDRDNSRDGGYGGSSQRSRDNRSSDLGFSDIRLKENVELIGKSPSNINIYKFNYKDSPTTYQGAMAHEVPWASVKHSNGYMMIDYNQIDVDFKKI